MSATLQQVDARIRKGEAAEASRLTPFVQQLFRKADPAFIDLFDPEALYAMAKDGLAFLAALPKAGGAVSVEVFDPSYAADGWEVPYTVVRLALRDRPFVVDSVRAELQRLGVTVYHVLHPILVVRRDEDGRVLAIHDRATADDEPGEANAEAFEMWFVERLDEPARRQAVLDGLKQVLHDTVLATDDYLAMRARLGSVVGELRAQAAGSADAELREELSEQADFLAWLDDGNFVFLGFRVYRLVEEGGERALAVDADSALGILRKIDRSAYREPVPVSQIPDALRARVVAGPQLIVTKTNAVSTVHRPDRMDYVGVKQLGEDGAVVGEQRFLGLLTSKAYATPGDQVPILRRKLQQVLELDGALPGSHDHKQIVSVFNSLPKAELVWADVAAVHREIRAVIDMEQVRELSLVLRPDPLSRGLSVMVIVPRDRYDSETRKRVQQHLTKALDAAHVDLQLAMSQDQDQVRMHFFLATERSAAEVDVKALEREVSELTRNWDDHLRIRAIAVHGEREGRRLAERYAAAFDARYKNDTTAAGALQDIANLELLPSDGVQVALVQPLDDRRGEGVTLFRIYHPGSGMALSDVLPLLENLGFRVLEQISYQLDRGGEARALDVFKVQDQGRAPIDVRAHGERVVEAAEAVLQGHAEDDRLNRLVLYGSLTVREVALLRAYLAYYVQLNAAVSRRSVNDALLAHPAVARRLVALFQARFDPGLQGDRQAAQDQAFADFIDSLAEVHSLPEDQVLRGLADLVLASVRCDYHRGHPLIAFKLDSAKVSQMPEPRPMFEIAVAGPTVEGTHLRGGRVARGGIRWSDRPDDFRTEVLGLMKTQMTKNAVIVPVGSKGGFVVKRAPSDREALRAFVQEQYRSYVKALLGLTDNVVDGQLVPPEGLVLHDEPDPYLVVAADKGTATFSDTANAVAMEAGFWLGDAFASGGSNGYDHKKEGITARGAWAAITRHFRELGIDPKEDPFSAVGIGDMSGDVFGNGMIYTPQLRLVAAFNHLHVFIDPDPPETAFAERQRLFALPRSSWADYDASLISAGGGVFERAAKRIPLSPEARRLLDVGQDEVSGQDLVKAVLRAKVDLLWNGGIGTYVKAGSERHSEAGDASNDGVRIDAGELRARIVGEGGNLGFTQLARVEYARAGGRIHTDAIDNSAGVDLSDHEVNLKLALQPLLQAGEISQVQRDRLLRELTGEVCELVLRDNRRQALALALAERRSRADLALFEVLIEYLTERGGLNPQVEHLPSRRQMVERARAGEGLTKPELAVVMAYVKMGLYRRLLETSVPDEPFFGPYLMSYFPLPLQERFPEALRDHPLRREVTATQMTNTVVDLLGPSFVQRTLRDTGATPVEVARAALVAMEVLQVPALVARLEGEVPGEAEEISAVAELAALEALVRSVEGVVRWLLRSDLADLSVQSLVDGFRGPLAAVRGGLAELLPAPERRRLVRSGKEFAKMGMPEAMAEEVALLEYLPAAMGVIEVARRAGVDREEVGRRYFALGERLRLGWLRDSLSELRTADGWEKQALGGLLVDLRLVQQDLTERYLRRRGEDPRLSLEAYLAQSPHLIRRYDEAIAQVASEESLSLASASVLLRLLGQTR